VARIKNIIKWHGGKWKLAPAIIKLAPPHKTYAELFGGSFAVGITKSKSKTEIFNDLDDELWMFWKVIRDHRQELITALSLTPSGRRELREAYIRNPEDSMIEIVRKLIVRCNQGIGSSNKENTGYRNTINKKDSCSPALGWYNLPDRVELLYQRIKNVMLEHKDALLLMDAFDHPQTWFYLDPPYLGETRGKTSQLVGYNHDMTNEEHIALCEKITNLKGSVIISGYDNPIYNHILQDWWRIDMEGFADRPSKHGREVKIESLWMNYRPQRLMF